MKPFTYKKLNVPDHKEITQQIYEFVRDHTPAMEYNPIYAFIAQDELLAAVPRLTEIANDFGLKIRSAAVIARPPGFPEGIHVDDDVSIGCPAVRWLWPVVGCEGSRTNFYDADPNHLISYVTPDTNEPYTLLPDEAPKTLIDSFELTEPVFFNTSIPHGIVVPPDLDKVRFSLAIGFEEVPEELLV